MNKSQANKKTEKSEVLKETKISKVDIDAKELKAFYRSLRWDDVEDLEGMLSNKKILEEFMNMSEETTHEVFMSLRSAEGNVIKLLVEKGVKADKIMNSLLDYSKEAFNSNFLDKYSEPLKILLKNGASGQRLINALGEFESDLWFIFHQENIELIRLFLESGTNANDLIRAASTGEHEGMESVFLKGNLEIPNLLLEFGADAKIMLKPTKKGRSVIGPLLNNTQINREDKLKFLRGLLEEGIDTKVISKDLNLLDPLIIELLREYKIKNAKAFISNPQDITFADLKEAVMQKSSTATNDNEFMEFDYNYKYEMSGNMYDKKTNEKIKEKSFKLPNAINWGNFENKQIEDYKYKSSSTCLELQYDVYELQLLPYAYACNFRDVNVLKLETLFRKYITQEEGDKYRVWKDLEYRKEGGYDGEGSTEFYAYILEPYIRDTLDFELLSEVLKEMNKETKYMELPKDFSMVNPFKLDIMKDYGIENKSDFWSVFCEIASTDHWQDLKDVSIKSII